MAILSPHEITSQKIRQLKANFGYRKEEVKQQKKQVQPL